MVERIKTGRRYRTGCGQLTAAGSRRCRRCCRSHSRQRCGCRRGAVVVVAVATAAQTTTTAATTSAAAAAASRAGILFRCFHVAMVDALVIAQTVQRAVHAFANVADRLFGRSHVHILDVTLQPRERRQILVARIAAEIIGAGRIVGGQSGRRNGRRRQMRRRTGSAS